MSLEHLHLQCIDTFKILFIETKISKFEVNVSHESVSQEITLD